MNQMTQTETKNSTQTSGSSKDVILSFLEKFKDVTEEYRPMINQVVKSLSFELSPGLKYIINKRVKQRVNKKKLDDIENVKFFLGLYSKHKNDVYKESAELYMKSVHSEYKETLYEVCADVDRLKGLSSGTTLHKMEYQNNTD